MSEKSCGTIPYTKINGTIHYLTIRARDDGYCGFPKGHVEKNETEQQTAIRETWEETSLRVKIIDGFRGEVKYRLHNGNRKTVIYFLAEFRGQRPHHNRGYERFEYALLPYEQAYHALTHASSKRLLQEANELLTQKSGV